MLLVKAFSFQELFVFWIDCPYADDCKYNQLYIFCVDGKEQ